MRAKQSEEGVSAEEVAAAATAAAEAAGGVEADVAAATAMALASAKRAEGASEEEVRAAVLEAVRKTGVSDAQAMKVAEDAVRLAVVRGRCRMVAREGKRLTVGGFDQSMREAFCGSLAQALAGQGIARCRVQLLCCRAGAVVVDFKVCGGDAGHSPECPSRPLR